MDIAKLDTVKNALLSRTEAIAQINFSGVTPSNADVQAGLAKKLGVDAERVVVKRIGTVYGGGSAIVKAYAYDDEATQKRVEPPVKEKKK